jgi:hypothetical protein
MGKLADIAIRWEAEDKERRTHKTSELRAVEQLNGRVTILNRDA